MIAMTTLQWARLSDRLFDAAVVIYLLGMVAYSAYLAFRREPMWAVARACRAVGSSSAMPGVVALRASVRNGWKADISPIVEANSAPHTRDSEPDAITGPVGEPVGEPPRGSTETAIVAPCCSKVASASASRLCDNLPAGRTPSDRGVPPAGITHNSWECLASVANFPGAAKTSCRSAGSSSSDSPSRSPSASISS